MKPRTVWLLDEGKHGHLVQSRGLLRELGKAVPLEVHEISARLTVPSGLLRSAVKRLLHRWRCARLFRLTHTVSPLPAAAPDLVVASGPGALLALEYFAKTRGCPSVFVQGGIDVPPGTVDAILRPAGPETRGDFIFIPLLFNEITPELLPAAAHPPRLRALFIGASTSKIPFTGADWDALAELVNRLWRKDGIPWLVTTAARTGEDLEKHLRSRIIPAAISEAVWYGESPRRVTREFLSRADEIFVTADSLTMLSEAVSSGRPVTAICPAALQLDAAETHQRYIAGLARDGFVALLALPGPDRLPPGVVGAAPDYQDAIRQLLAKLRWTP